MSVAAQPHVLKATNGTAEIPGLDMVAATSADGTTVSLRVVNSGELSIKTAVIFHGEWHSASLNATLTTLAAPGGEPTAANGLATPTAVIPVKTTFTSYRSGQEMQWPAMSVSTLVITRPI